MAGGDANVLFGYKWLTEDKLKDLDVDGQPEIGVSVNLDFQWPIVLAIDLLSTHTDKTRTTDAAFPVTTKTKIDTLELDLGVRKIWEIKKWRPYVGGGLAMIQFDAKQTTSIDILGNIVQDTLIDDDYSTVGFWVGGGTLWTLPEGFNLGAELRYSDADADLTSEGFTAKQSFDAGGYHIGVMLGYHW
jgi:opacity protein-like surface antigen